MLGKIGITLLWALLATSCSGFHGSGLTKNFRIPGDGRLPRPEATTVQGKVRGINMVTYCNRTIAGFLGIPYAQPPVGDLRFRPPVPAHAWRGTLDASNDRYWCPQFDDEGKFVGHEDCLYHNVFTPKLPTSRNTTLFPVMVFIVGGGFKDLNNSVERYSPDFLLDENIVLVIPSARVGVLGFLSTGDEISPGNYGLKDIVRCLEWVRENIHYFGGDPNQVTLFGGSSGAMSVHLLALSKSTDGLIHKYIIQSGSAFSNGVNQRRETCMRYAVQLGQHLGCPTNTSTHLVNCLRGFDASKLVDTRSLFYVWKAYPLNVWLPTTEPDIEGALLTDDPRNLYATGKIRDIPSIATVNRDEGIGYTMAFHENLDLFEEFLADIDLALPCLLSYQHTVDVDDITAYTNALKSYYLNDLTADRRILLANFSKLTGDALFGYSIYRAVQQQWLLAKSPQYFGCFQYRGIFSLTYFYSHTTKYYEVSHGDELIYLFGHQGNRYGPPGAEFNEVDHFMIDTLVQLWTSFATHGYPTTLNSVSTVIWKPYSSLKNYLRIGNGSDPSIKMQYDINPERMKFWDELTKTLATSSGTRNPRKTSSVDLH